VDRYVPRRAIHGFFAEGSPDDEQHKTLTVHEPDDAPIATGLLDASGEALFRVVVRSPIGFQFKRITS
jgi:hypothetical protein